MMSKTTGELETTIRFQGREFLISSVYENDHIFNIIRRTHSFYEDDLLQFIAKIPLKDGVVVDAGANIGNHTIFFSKVLKRKTWSFEPSIQIFGALRRTVEGNRDQEGGDIVLANAALGEEGGAATLLLETGNSGMSHLVRDETSQNNQILEAVTIQKLDDALPKKEPVALIKIDVEGFEVEVIKGGLKTIERCKPLMTLECHSQQALTQIDDLLWPLGYRPIGIKGRSPNFIYCHETEYDKISRYAEVAQYWTVQKSSEAASIREAVNVERRKTTDITNKLARATEQLQALEAKQGELSTAQALEDRTLLETLRAQIEESRSGLDQQKQDLANISRSLVELGNDLREARAITGQRDDAIAHLKGEVGTLTAQLEAAVQGARDKESELERTRTELRALGDAQGKLREESLETEREKIRLQEQVKSLTVRLEVVTEDIRTRNEEIERTRSEFRALDDAQRNLQEQIKRLEAELAQSRETAQANEARLQAALAKSQDETRKTVETLENLRYAHFAGREALTTAHQEIDSLGKRLRSAERSKVRSDQLRNELVERVTKLETLLSERDASLKSARDALSAHTAKTMTSQGFMDALNQFKASEADRRRSLEKMLLERESALDAKTKEAANLARKADRLQAAYDERSALLERARAASVEMREQRDAANAKLGRRSNPLKRIVRSSAESLARNTAIRSTIRRLVPGRLRQRLVGYMYSSPAPSSPARTDQPKASRDTPSDSPDRPARTPAKTKSVADLLPRDRVYDCALICGAYPGGRRDYGGGFIHSRVAAYNKAGLSTLIIESSALNKDNWFNEHDGIDCLRANNHDLGRVLQQVQKRYGILLMHSPTPDIVEALPRRTGPAVAWLHGFEVRDYRRLFYNFTSAQRELLRGQLDDVNASRFQSARKLFANTDIHKVFVSDYIRRVAETDVGATALNAHVIPNFIDTDHFSAQQKSGELGRKVLLIRSFAARNYANDIATEAISLLAGRDGFKKIEFTLCGFGRDFQALTEPLRGLSNVTLREGVLDHDQMKAEHARHGVFLAPTRFDTQGVTLGEAMSSGLACITNPVTAIPEYCDDQSAMLVRPDDPRAYAEAIWSLTHDPDRVSSLSTAGAARVRQQCGYDATIARELDLIRSLAPSKS